MKRTTFFLSLIVIFSTIVLQTTFAQIVFDHGHGVNSVAFSSDGNILASGGVDGRVHLWNVKTDRYIATLERHRREVFSVAFSPDGTTLASGSLDGIVKLWNVETQINIATLKGHATWVTSVAFSPDGTTVASGAFDGIVKLWDVATQQNTATFGGHDASILEGVSGDFPGLFTGGWLAPLSFSPDGRTLAAGAGNSIKLWDMATRENIATFKVPGEFVVSAVSTSFSPDGRTLAAGVFDGTVKLWNVETETNIATLVPPVSPVRSLTRISFSPDGTLIASTLGERVALWDVETRTQINTLPRTLPELPLSVLSVSFSHDGSLASGGQDGIVRVWDAESLLKDPLVNKPLTALAASPLTEATLDGSVITLTLNEYRFINSEWGIRNALSINDIDGVYISRRYFGLGVNRINDMQVTVALAYDGTDFDTDTVLTFTVGAEAIADNDEQVFNVQVPVNATQNSNAIVRISPSPVVVPAVGEELNFNLNISSGENVAGYQATVSYDSTALNLSGATNGDYLPADAFFDRHGRTITATTHAGVANGNGTLATLTFRVLDFKPSTVTLYRVYLIDTDGKRWEATTVGAKVTIPAEPRAAIFGDINRDGVVNIQDLVIVGVRLGDRGPNSADLNGDHLVDIVDLVLVANAIGAGRAAPSLTHQDLQMLTISDVKGWLTQAQKINSLDPDYIHGIDVLARLLAALTPKETSLLPNFPNPFNPETWIPYQLAKPADVTLTIYDIRGVVVRQLKLGHQAAGVYTNRSHAIHWDGRNSIGEKVATGLYLYTLSAEDFSATRKMLIRK